VPPRARLRVFPARVPSGRREGRVLRMRVPVGRVGPMVRLRDRVTVRGVGGLDVDVIVVAEGGEDVAPGLVRPGLAGGRELAGELALDAAVTRVPSEALRNGVTKVI
jgi:hypothetical protein